jgi:hypothetical protein
MFNGQNVLKYEMWSRRTKVFLQAQGNYIWLSIVIGYDSLKREKDAAKKELNKYNKITMDFIWEGLPRSTKGRSRTEREDTDKSY